MGLSKPGPVAPISDSNLLSEIAQAAEGLEFIDGPRAAVLLGKLLRTCFSPPPGPPGNSEAS
jgi:hypothetical protein